METKDGRFVVTADIRYLDGTLKGMEIPSGFRVTVPSLAHAIRTAKYIETTRRNNDFVRAIGTGSRYVYTSAPSYFEL